MCSNAVLGSCLCVCFIYLVHASIVDVICNRKKTIVLFLSNCTSAFTVAVVLHQPLFCSIVKNIIIIIDK